jgi:Flp pilus assembly protein TadG
MRRSRDRRDERGTMTLFLLGLCVAILFLGGLVVDFWRVLAVRRELAAMADAAATAGANGLDESSLRTGGDALDPAAARGLALAELQTEARHGEITDVDVVADSRQVVVRLQSHVQFSLLGILVRGRDFTVTVTATAQPRRGP